MATILIGYDVHPPEGRAYDDLVRAIQSLGVWWHHLETIWIVKSNQTPAAIRNQLKPHVGADDQLLVIDISGDTADWFGVNDSGSTWLKNNV
ncbi:MAG: hypothetical protein ABI192_14035 [Bradyrhizobium sp.]